MIEMNGMEKTTASVTNTVQAARQARGGVPKNLMELSREQARFRQKIRAALKNGPMTVPELHAATGLPANEILWYLMAWKKYGHIVESEACEDYYKYAMGGEERK